MGECKQVNTFSKAILLRKVFKILKSGKKIFFLPISFLISDINSNSYTRHDSISKCYQSLPTVAVSVCIPPPHEICYQQSQSHNPSGSLIYPLRKATQSEG